MSQSTSAGRYAVVSPVKNEQRFIGETIASMIAQDVKPIRWVIVDDASTDDTARIIKESAAHHAWIQYLRYPGEAVRKTGSAEVHAFNFGCTAIRDEAYDYIVKLDGDVRFDGNYFETLLSRFAGNVKLGIASGIYLEQTGDSWEPVTMPGYHAAGASKVIRRECFDQIGGFIAERGWDTVDEIRAQAHGWETRHFPDIKFFHLRKEGTGMGRLHTNVMHGEIFYRTGGSRAFLIAKVLNRMVRGDPFLLAGLAMAYGYLSALVRRQALLVTPTEARAYRRLLVGRLRDGMGRFAPVRS